MSTAMRAFLLIAFSMLFAVSVGFVYAQEEDSDANEACPSVRDVYVYVSGVGYGETVNGKVNLYGKKCQKIDDAKTLVRGKCTGPEVCKGEEYYGLDRQWHKLSGDKTELPKLEIEGVKKAVYEGVPAPATQAPLTPSESLWNQMIDPTKPLGEQKTPLLSPSANSFDTLLKQSGAQPSGFVDRMRQSVSNFLFPPSLNDTVGTTPLEGGTIPGIDPKKVQTTSELGGTPGVTGFGQSQSTVLTEKGWLESAWSGVKEFLTPSDVPPTSPTNPEELPTVERTNPSEAELKAAEKQIDNVVKWDLARTDLQEAKDSIEAAQRRNDEQKTILDDSEKQIAQNLKQSDDIRAKAPVAIEKNETTIASLERLKNGLESGSINTIKDAKGTIYSGAGALEVVEKNLAAERKAYAANQAALTNANTYVASWRDGPGGYYDAFGNEYATKNLASLADSRAQVDSVTGSLSSAGDNITSRLDSLEKARSMSFALNDIRYDAFGNEYVSAKVAAASDHMQLQQSEIALKLDAARTQLEQANADRATVPWYEKIANFNFTNEALQTQDAVKLAQKNVDTLTTSLKQSDAVVTNLQNGSYPEAVVEKLATTPTTPEEVAQRNGLIAKMADYSDAVKALDNFDRDPSAFIPGASQSEIESAREVLEAEKNKFDKLVGEYSGAIKMSEASAEFVRTSVEAQRPTGQLAAELFSSNAIPAVKALGAKFSGFLGEASQGLAPAGTYSSLDAMLSPAGLLKGMAVDPVLNLTFAPTPEQQLAAQSRSDLSNVLHYAADAAIVATPFISPVLRGLGVWSDVGVSGEKLAVAGSAGREFTLGDTVVSNAVRTELAARDIGAGAYAHVADTPLGPVFAAERLPTVADTVTAAQRDAIAAISGRTLTSADRAALAEVGLDTKSYGTVQAEITTQVGGRPVTETVNIPRTALVNADGEVVAVQSRVAGTNAAKFEPMNNYEIIAPVENRGVMASVREKFNEWFGPAEPSPVGRLTAAEEVSSGAAAEPRLLTGPKAAEPSAPNLARVESPSIVPPAEPAVPAVATQRFAPTAEQINNLSRGLIVAKTAPVAAEVDAVRGLNIAVEVDAAAQAGVRAGELAADAPIVRAARDDLLAASRQLEEASLYTRLAPLDAEGIVPIDRIYRAGTGEVIAERVAPIASEEAYQILGQELQELQGLAGATRPVPPAPASPAPPLAPRDIVFPANKPVFQATPTFSPLPQPTTVTTLVMERPAFDNMLANLLNPSKLLVAPLAPALTAAEKRAIELYGSTDGVVRNLRIQEISPSSPLFKSANAALAEAKAGLTTEGLRISDITGAIHKGNAVVAVQKPVVFPGESPYAIVAPLKEVPEAALAQAAPKTALPENVTVPRSLWQSIATVPGAVRTAVVTAMLSNPMVGEFVNIIAPALAEPNQIASLVQGKGAGAPTVVPVASVPATVPSVVTVAPGKDGGIVFSDGRPSLLAITPVDLAKVIADARYLNPVTGIGTVFDDAIVSSGVRGGAASNPALFSSPYLPLGTMVKVCGPGGCTHGVIGDFGPNPKLEEKHIVDLTNAAGKAVGLNGKATVTVSVVGYLGGDTALKNVTAGLAIAKRMNAGSAFADAVGAVRASGYPKVADITPVSPAVTVAANTVPAVTPLPAPAPAAPAAGTTPEPVVPAAPPAVVKPEVVALQEQAAGIQTQLDTVGKNITTVQANANTLKGVQGSIAGAADKAKTTEDTLQALTYTRQAVNAGARLVNPIENIARTAGDTQLLRSAQVLAKERSIIASGVSGALNTYKTTQSRLALTPYMGLRESVPALLEKGNALIAQAQRTADATTASLQRHKATLAAQLEKANQQLADAQKTPAVVATVEEIVPTAKVTPLPPDEVVVVAKVDDVMTTAADMKGAWPGFTESEGAVASALAVIPEPVRIISVTAAPEKPYMPRVVQYSPTVNAPSAPLPTLQARFSNAVRKEEIPQVQPGSGGARPETSPTPEPTVYILMGGTGAGKTTVASGVLPKLNPSAAIIDDASLSAADITRSVNDALAAGKVPNVVYVHRDPVEAFAANRGGPIDAFAGRYVESQQAVKGLLENQALQKEGLQVTLLDNSRGLGNAVPMTREAFSAVPRPSLAELKQQLLTKTDAMYEMGAIDAQEYKAITGTEAPAKVALAPAEPVAPAPEILPPTVPSAPAPTGPIETGWLGSEVEGQIGWLRGLYDGVSDRLANLGTTIRDAVPAIPEPTYQPITPIPTSKSLVPNTAPVGPSSPVTSPLAQTSPTQYVNAEGAASPEVGKVMEFYPWKMLPAPRVRGNLNTAALPTTIELPAPAAPIPTGYGDWYALTEPAAARPPVPSVLENVRPLLPQTLTPPPPTLGQVAEVPAGRTVQQQAQDIIAGIRRDATPPPVLPDYADWYAQTAERDALFGTPAVRTGAQPAIVEDMLPLGVKKGVPAPTGVVTPPTAAPVVEPQQLQLPFAPQQLRLPLDEPVQPVRPPSVPNEPRQLDLPLDDGQQLQLPLNRPVQPNTVAVAPSVWTRISNWFTGRATPAVTPTPTVTGGGGGAGGNRGGPPDDPTAEPQPNTGDSAAKPGWWSRNWGKVTIGGGTLLFGPPVVRYFLAGDSTPAGGPSPDKKALTAPEKKTGGGPGETPPPKDDKTVRPPGGPKACGPNDTYASSGCYPPYGTRTTSEIPSSGDYCISSIEPLVVVPGVKPGPNCYNYSGSKNPLSSLGSTLGQLLGRLFGTTQPAPTQQTQPTKPPVTPPTATTTPAKPYATLVASPTSVTEGGKSRLIWTSVNTSGCELFAPDNFLMATGTRGSTSTLPLATTTAFSLDCRAPSGATTTASTTVSVR